MILAGDIGGTKTALAFFAQGAPRQPLSEKTFLSQNFSSLESIVREFLAGRTERIASASFGVAGVVLDDKAKVTNLNWIVDANSLSQTIAAPVYLLNDLEAIARAVPHLNEKDLETLNVGESQLRAPIAVIAPGTGLGEAFLVWDGARYRAHASEGGHADFAPTNEIELELLKYLLPRLGHVSYERVCSGRGLPNLYAFLKDSGRLVEPDWLRDKLLPASDATPIIIEYATENKAEICAASLELFISILGAEAGNLALKFLATSGVYLGGGIPPRIVTQLKAKNFFQSFTRKGRFSELLARIPIHIIVNHHAALFGAAWRATENE
ncbi:MAG: glucokinase [Chloroflexi bacterium]|nr:glucokinase [Chloroflexota bacterium]